MQDQSIQQFQHEQFGTIRTATIDGEPWFVAKDVCSALGYKNASKAISDHIDAEDKLNNESLSSLGQRGGWLINESGLYSLILTSKLPEAKSFKRWVTHEVLPSIRRDGGYMVARDDESDEQIMARALLIANKTIERKNKQIAKMQPKAFFADAVSASNTSILVGELAKLLKQNGFDIGQNRLFALLRKDGYLIGGKRSDKNMPTQKSMELKLFEIKERTFSNPDGSTRITKTPKVTGKGQVYFVNRYCNSAQQAFAF